MAQSFLEKDLGGMFNPTLRFAFTNITNEDFTSYWDKIPIVVKPHETIELSSTTPIAGPGLGHALAVKMTGEMVDKIIIGEAKVDEAQKDQPYYRSPKGSDLGVPAARQVWENQILRQLDPDEESPAMQAMRKEILREINNEVQPPVAISIPTSSEEFADATKSVPTVAKKAVRTKKVA